MDDAVRSLVEREGCAEFVVRVRPQAPRTAVRSRRDDGVWKVDVAAVPEDGAANDALRRFVAEAFDVPLSHVAIVSGQSSREKRVRVTRRSA